MDASVKYRAARPLERFEPYAFAVGWVASWAFPQLGLLTWVVLFAPDMLVVPAWRYVWRTTRTRTATVRRSMSGVELVAADVVVETIAHADVDALATVYDGKSGTATELRLERKTGRGLVFELSGTTPAALATALGIDGAKARRRYALSSRLVPRGLFLILVGLGAIAWSIFGSPSAETAWYLLLYQRAILMPLVLLYAIPTVFDVAADGVAWRWLLWHRYHPFESITSIVPIPADAPVQKAGGFALTTKDGEARNFFAKPGTAVGVISHLLQAFAESREHATDERPIDDWLPVRENETTVAWIERLRAMGASDGGYRGVSVSHLWTLAEDPRAPSSMRCGAALVLGSTDAGRDRLRVIATQIVDPAFSSLLEAIARQATARDLEDLVTRALSPQ